MTGLGDSTLRRLQDAAGRPDPPLRYRVEEEIGRGGTGVVYRAWDDVLERFVAFKVSAGPLDEARTAARLEHPSIVPVHDAGTLPDGRSYYVMKLVDGPRLDEFALASPTVAPKLRAFRKICDAVEYAHSRGVVHRDIKPRNVMVGRFGEVFLLDWGAGVMGTPGYMAPEQTEDSNDPAVDIHALGVMLRNLAGAGGPRPILAIAAKAASAAPGGRYPSVAALSEDVDRFLDRLPVSAYRESIPERARRFCSRNSVLLLLFAAYVLVRAALYFLRPAATGFR